MTREEKSLLLQDLSARLPYKVMVCVDNDRKPLPLKGITFEEESKMFNTPSRYACEIGGGAYSHIYVKPYLRPMSSMTEEENKQVKELCILLWSDSNGKIGFDGFGNISGEDVLTAIDWLNAHHFDYRGLIAKGLALEAPEGMYTNN